jgi:hypothetical protein
MDYADALEHYEAITVIEAQEALMSMKLADYPRAKPESRKQFHRETRKLAYPPGFQREMEFDEFIEVMQRGR